MGPCGLLWDCMGPYETVWAPYGLLLNRMGTYGRVELNTVWDRIRPYGHPNPNPYGFISVHTVQ